jgi:5'-nucleotidase
MKPIVYIDMDNTLADFVSGIDRLSAKELERFEGDYDDAPGIFSLMNPMPGAVEAIRALEADFDLYVLSTAPWDNPSAWQEKVECIRRWFGAGEEAPLYKRLILSHHKHLNRGDYLIDDRPGRGAADFEGEWVHFGSDEHPGWPEIVAYLRDRLNGARRSSAAVPLSDELVSKRFYELQNPTGARRALIGAVTRGECRQYFEWHEGEARWAPLNAATFVSRRDRGHMIPIDEALAQGISQRQVTLPSTGPK